MVDKLPNKNNFFILFCIYLLKFTNSVPKKKFKDISQFMNHRFIGKMPVTLITLLVLISLNACINKKTYELKKEGTDIILTGIVQKKVLMNAKKYPWFTWGMNDYKPNAEQISLLKPYAKNTRVLIFAGSWCSDTQRDLPKFYKIAALIGLPENQTEIIMLNRDKKCKNINPGIMEVNNVPAFIFYYEGKEKGRIIEKPVATVEEDMLRILSLK